MITGTSGFLGSQIAHLAKSKDYDVIGVDLKPFHYNNFTTDTIDVSSFEQVVTIASEYDPDLIIHCATIADVDFCERNRDVAERVNVKGTENVAKACNQIGTKMTYISTDQVFDGVLPPDERYDEEDEPRPVNFYGLSKLKGETEVKENLKDYVIARTANLYGYNLGESAEQGFAYDTIRTLKSGVKIEASSDFIQTPTSAQDYATVLLELFEHHSTGLFHVAGGQKVSRLEFAYTIADFFHLDRTLIVPVEKGGIRNLALDCTKVEKELDRKMLNLDEGLAVLHSTLSKLGRN